MSLKARVLNAGLYDTLSSPLRLSTISTGLQYNKRSQLKELQASDSTARVRGKTQTKAQTKTLRKFQPLTPQLQQTGNTA